ncbi:MAG TPA: MarR family transcriptional regulator [Chitinophagaceae bacterium]
MSIRNEIRQQRQFRNEHQKAAVNILFSSNWLMEQIKKFLQQEDITPQQYNILRILRGSGRPLSTLQIRERMLDKMSDTSRIVDRLLKKGLVEKKTSEADKRLVDVTISADGLQLLERLDKRNEALDGILSKLSTEEAQTLNDLLDKMRGSEE